MAEQPAPDPFLLPLLTPVPPPRPEVGRLRKLELDPLLDTHDEQAAPKLRHPVVGGKEDRRPQRVAQLLEMGHDLALSAAVLLVGQSLVRETRDVLEQERPRPNLIDQREHVRPQLRPLVVRVGPLEPPTLRREGLATRATQDHVNISELPRQIRRLEVGDRRMLGSEPKVPLVGDARVLVLVQRERQLEPRRAKPGRQASRAGEQIGHCKLWRFRTHCTHSVLHTRWDV